MNMIHTEAMTERIELPLIRSGELIIFPHTILPYFSPSAEISTVIEKAMESDRLLFFGYPSEDEPRGAGLHTAGTVVKIVQIFKMKNNSLRMLVEALYRAELITVFKQDDDNEYVRVTPLLEKKQTDSDISLLMQQVKQSFEHFGTLVTNMPKEIAKQVHDAEHGDKLVDIISTHVPFQRDTKLELISMIDTKKRLEHVSILLATEIEMKKLQGEIQNRVKEKLEQTQKEYFLNEQIRQINKELGKEPDEADEADELLETIRALSPPKEVIEKAEKEAGRLKKLQAMAPESGVLRTYLEWLADLPWSQTTEDRYDIRRSKQILDEDHYNMKRAKERILDFLAIRSIQKSVKGPILCLVGPPGTGKTSLGKSIARTIGREFIRISLGGIRDEAEIRGHRKTYVGALPGKIIQSMKRGGTANPVFLLDEIDKMSSDFRGDPASALLEVLDPEQNSTFTDHYLEVPFDLSQVLFVATANSLHTIPAPLRDRMEVIEIPGYSDVEKYAIAKQFLIPKQINENGLEKSRIKFRKDSVMKIIHEYTMESGVRNLERTIGSILRKSTRIWLDKHPDVEDIGEYSKTITAKTVSDLLGKELYSTDMIEDEALIGLAHGLAWTEMGGRMLSVEVSLMSGSGNLILTGNLGEVMKESARISLSYLQAHAAELGIDADSIKKQDLHIHVPQGAIPKDGPSAGITLCAALFSAIRKIPTPPDISMTGEMTLTGRVLPIGGVKEKVLASYRHGIKQIILPHRNEKDALNDLPKNVRDDLRIHYVQNIHEVLHILFPDDCPSEKLTE